MLLGRYQKVESCRHAYISNHRLIAFSRPETTAPASLLRMQVYSRLTRKVLHGFCAHTRSSISSGLFLAIIKWKRSFIDKVTPELLASPTGDTSFIYSQRMRASTYTTVPAISVGELDELMTSIDRESPRFKPSTLNHPHLYPNSFRIQPRRRQEKVMFNTNV